MAHGFELRARMSLVAMALVACSSTAAPAGWRAPREPAHAQDDKIATPPDEPAEGASTSTPDPSPPTAPSAAFDCCVETCIAFLPDCATPACVRNLRQCERDCRADRERSCMPPNGAK